MSTGQTLRTISIINMSSFKLTDRPLIKPEIKLQLLISHFFTDVKVIALM